MHYLILSWCIAEYQLSLQTNTVLFRARQKKCNAALRHKQMQLRTVQILYEYEVEDANSLYMRAFTDLQEKLVKELTVVKNRVQASRRKISAQHINRQDHTSGKQSEEFKQNPEPQPVAGRSLRSTGIILYTPTHHTIILSISLTHIHMQA